MKSQIFNLIILDESGSMSFVTRQTINGCNETLETISAVQEKFAETQEHVVSIYAFEDGRRPSRYIIKNVPIADVKHITSDDYTPGGSTPLYDAVGATLSDLKATTKRSEDAIGSVTIITDGEKNSSTRYTLPQVAKMIEALKEQGWNFNFIGANIDVSRVSRSLNIDNAMEFKQDEAGTAEMFEKERRSREAYYSRMEEANMEYNACMAAAAAAEMSEEDMEELCKKRLERRKNASKGYFDV